MKNLQLDSRQRLESISHHFLGGPSIAKHNRRPPVFLPILTDETKHTSLTLELHNELIREGLLSNIINTGEINDILVNFGFLTKDTGWEHPFGDKNYLNKIDSARSTIKNHLLSNIDSDIYIFPYTYAQSFIPVLFRKSVIITSPTLDEIRMSYCDIKNLIRHSVSSIGVIMTYDDINIATQHFSKLYQGVKKFMDFNIEECGYFHCNTYAQYGHETDKSHNEIKDISRELIRTRD